MATLHPFCTVCGTHSTDKEPNCSLSFENQEHWVQFNEQLAFENQERCVQFNEGNYERNLQLVNVKIIA